MVTSIFIRRFRHPWMVMALYVPLGFLISYLAVRSHTFTPESFLLDLSLGVFAWTLVEYGLHRYVFHWTEVREPWRTLASGLHMEHHASTEQEDLIIAPPAVGLIFGFLVYLLLALVFRNFAAAAVAECGLFIGYILYEWVHFGAHCFLPTSRTGKFLRKYHLQHHHKCPDRQFGVTTPLWDLVFGTH